jgi:hypothetical protein
MSPLSPSTGRMPDVALWADPDVLMSKEIDQMSSDGIEEYAYEMGRMEAILQEQLDTCQNLPEGEPALLVVASIGRIE